MNSSPSNDKSDLVFKALASQSRRQMIDLLVASPGIGVQALASHFQISRIGVMKHLKVLEEAGLVLSKKQGRTRHLFFNSVPIQMVYDRWTDQFSGFWSTQLVDMKSRIESESDSQGNQSA